MCRVHTLSKVKGRTVEFLRSPLYTAQTFLLVVIGLTAVPANKALNQSLQGEWICNSLFLWALAIKLVVGTSVRGEEWLAKGRKHRFPFKKLLL